MLNSTANINENEVSSSSQREETANHLLKGRWLTAADALRLFGCSRLAARINELRETMLIISYPVSVINRHGRKVRVVEYHFIEMIEVAA